MGMRMIVLVVDDQLSVINGIVAKVDFSRLGIETVLTATSAYEARSVIGDRSVDILLCDIEMPGESGLELNQWIRENHPRMIRIFLTAHADFSYAQESIRLGCFDYIVQPAPYDEIEEVLHRAVRKINYDRRQEELSHVGKLYKTNETEILDNTVFNLFSRDEATVRQAMALLNEIGYPLRDDSHIRLIIVAVYPDGPQAGNLLYPTVKKAILTALKAINIGPPAFPADTPQVFPLVTQNKFHQPVILLFNNRPQPSPEITDRLRRFLNLLADALPAPTAAYISDITVISRLRDEIGKLHAMIDNNVSLKPGLFFNRQPGPGPEAAEPAEHAAEWERLLKTGQRKIFRTNVLSYLDGLVAIDRANFRSLCDLHQQLTQIFFSYFYDHNIDIPQLFNDRYRYNDYMEGFKSIPALRESIDFMLRSMDTARPGAVPVINEIDKAKDYILSHLAQNISVRDVADYVHLSPEYFTKLFKKETGQNIKNYMLQTKVDVAKELLENPNISVSLIALELGYSNFSHFTQMFKKYEDITPTDYRKRHQKNMPPPPV